jgi:hypothetical protein
MGKLGLNSGYIGSDQRTTTNGVVGYDKYYLERRNGRFLPVLEGDPDAQAFFTRVAAAGGILSENEEFAVTQLVIQMKADGIWDKMKAIYPMVGASAAACAQNLKSSSFTGTFTAGWTFASTGTTPNGTSAYMDTGLTPSTALGSINNVHLSMYSRTQNSSVSGHNMGVDQSANSLNLAQYFAAVSVKLFMNGEYPTNAAEFNETNTLGLAIGSATSSTSRKLYFNGSLLNTDTNTQLTNLPTSTLLLGCGRDQSAGGIPAYFTPHQNSFSSIGEGLTDTEASNFYTAVQAFQTTLSRNV